MAPKTPIKACGLEQKTDVTEDVISSVFDWFVGNMKDEHGKRTEYRITYPDTDYELVMRKKE
nr:MAG TPA: hypothetical protein [Caudoviricetes sp.]